MTIVEIMPLYGHIILIAKRTYPGLLTAGKEYRLSQIVQMKTSRNLVVARAYVVLTDKMEMEACPPHYFTKKEGTNA